MSARNHTTDERQIEAIAPGGFRRMGNQRRVDRVRYQGGACSATLRNEVAHERTRTEDLVKQAKRIEKRVDRMPMHLLRDIVKEAARARRKNDAPDAMQLVDRQRLGASARIDKQARVVEQQMVIVRGHEQSASRAPLVAREHGQNRARQQVVVVVHEDSLRAKSLEQREERTRGGTRPCTRAPAVLDIGQCTLVEGFDHHALAGTKHVDGHSIHFLGAPLANEIVDHQHAHHDRPRRSRCRADDATSSPA
jgi:hypothetical protein